MYSNFNFKYFSTLKSIYLLRKKFLLNLIKRDKILYIWQKYIRIFPEFVGYNFYVYDGRLFRPMHVSENMVGYTFGHFFITKQSAKVKDKKKKRNKKK